MFLILSIIIIENIYINFVLWRIPSCMGSGEKNVLHCTLHQWRSSRGRRLTTGADVPSRTKFNLQSARLKSSRNLQDTNIVNKYDLWVSRPSETQRASVFSGIIINRNTIRQVDVHVVLSATYLLIIVKRCKYKTIAAQRGRAWSYDQWGSRAILLPKHEYRLRTVRRAFR